MSVGSFQLTKSTAVNALDHGKSWRLSWRKCKGRGSAHDFGVNAHLDLGSCFKRAHECSHFTLKLLHAFAVFALLEGQVGKKSRDSGENLVLMERVQITMCSCNVWKIRTDSD